ncbi:MAG: hypothetical protein Q8916_08450 [Bacteroidota bacterium]|nr:hypothetical protein [Bacteroidota bacterium]
MDNITHIATIVAAISLVFIATMSYLRFSYEQKIGKMLLEQKDTLIPDLLAIRNGVTLTIETIVNASSDLKQVIISELGTNTSKVTDVLKHTSSTIDDKLTSCDLSIDNNLSKLSQTITSAIMANSNQISQKVDETGSNINKSISDGALVTVKSINELRESLEESVKF